MCSMKKVRVIETSAIASICLFYLSFGVTLLIFYINDSASTHWVLVSRRSSVCVYLCVCICLCHRSPVFPLHVLLQVRVTAGYDFSALSLWFKKKRRRGRMRGGNKEQRVNYHLFLVPFKGKIKAASHLPSMTPLLSFYPDQPLSELVC